VHLKVQDKQVMIIRSCWCYSQVVEIGKGSKVKYELDKKSGLIKVCCH
jgi:inorganic pyrophosphatase